MSAFWQYMVWGNSIKDWGIAIGVFAGLCIFIRVFEFLLIRYLKRLAEKTVTQFDDFVIEIIHTCVVPILYFGSAYVAMRSLNFNDTVYAVVHTALMVVFTFYVLRIITSAIKYTVYSYLNKQEDAEVKKKQARGILIIVNVIVWMLGGVFLLDNLGKDVTTIIAGLGVGGIAIALAAQTILGDLFSYFVIFFDRPFEIGDFIVVDDKSGTVEYIGVKTTRIRTLTGDILVISNTNLTNSRLHNFKKLQERRILFKLGVIYQTTHEQLKAIPGYIKEIIDNVEGVRFDRSHFSGYGNFSLDFETVYYVLEPDYPVYMDKQQQIYLAIFKKFEDEGIVFAYPTQTMFLTMDKGDQLNINTKMVSPSADA
ncbi:MAG: mechanosensitive ion channel family protein [Chitinophagales bacterium]|nr:mechanosensitive ion channel family protein [Chitinophagales bacterium]